MLSCAHPLAHQEYNLEEPKIGKALLGAGDVVDIRIFDEKDLSGSHQISSEGFVRLPLIGMIQISGMDSEQAAALIAAEYQKKYLKNPEVSLFVQQFNSRKIYLLGQVKSPGPYPYEEKMTLIAAVAKAGGPTQLAAANRTLISRIKDGKKVRLTAKVSDIGKGEAEDIAIFPGDIIFIPESLF